VIEIGTRTKENKLKERKHQRSLTNHPIWKSFILLAASMSSGLDVAGTYHTASSVMPILPCCFIYFKVPHVHVKMINKSISYQNKVRERKTWYLSLYREKTDAWASSKL
jgi:hypothetical protein